MFQNKQLDFIDCALIWSVRLLVLTLPFMFFNPMIPVFHRLQISEIFFVLTFILFLWQLMVKKVHLPSPGLLFYVLGLFVAVLFLSSFFSLSPKQSIIESIKMLYLFFLAVIIYLVGHQYHLRVSLWHYMGYGFLIVIVFGLLGILLLLFNIHTFLAYKTGIISLALGIQNWLPFVPRVSSLLRPTGNMTGAYLAGMTLPCLALYFAKDNRRDQVWKNLAILVIIGIMGLLTMSRAFVGVLLALYFGLTIFKWQIPYRKLFVILILIAAIITWLVLMFYSILYPLHFSVKYSNNPDYKKEIIVLDGVKKPNPIYFMRNGIGLEKINVSLDYAYDHYAWLKYGGWRLFKQYPWLGVGLGNYSNGVALLAKESVLSDQLVAYRSAQSQYATMLGEIGLVGTGMFFLIVIILLVYLLRRYIKEKDALSLALFLSLLIIALIAIDLDVIAFRWIWGLIAIALLPSNCSLDLPVSK